MTAKKKKAAEEKPPTKETTAIPKKTTKKKKEAAATKPAAGMGVNPAGITRKIEEGIFDFPAPGTGTSMKKTQTVLKKVFKEYDPTVILDANKLTRPWPSYPTGSIILNYQIGGRPNAHGVKPCDGYPRGRITNVYGPEGSGKTSLALAAAKAVCSIGGRVGFLDWENAISPAYAKVLGIPVDDTDVFDLKQPNTLEDGLKILWTWASHGVDLIVMDSIGAAVPSAIFGQNIADMGETGQIGLAARKWSYFLPKFQRRIRQTGSVVFAISQTRKNIGSYGSGDQAQGGEAWKFFSALRLRLLQAKPEMALQYNHVLNKNEKRPIGINIRVKIDKAKLDDSQNTETAFFFRFNHGADNVLALLDIGEAHGMVKKGGTGWMAWVRADGSEVKGHGKEKLREVVIQQGLESELYNQVHPLLGIAPQDATKLVAEEESLDDFDFE